VRFPDRLLLPFVFDPALLVRDLEGLSSQSWTRHYVRANYDGDWSAIPLRAPAGERHPLRQIYSDPTCQSFVDTPMLQSSGYFRHVLDRFECPLRSVRLMRLTPGSIIKEHTDQVLSFEEGEVRIHVPITTNDGVEFYLNGTRVILEAGTSWYLRLSDPHSVRNMGDTDRVHLVINATVNDWITAVFEEAARLAQPAPAGPLSRPAAPPAR
jgi:hypothetical protein